MYIGFPTCSDNKQCAATDGRHKAGHDVEQAPVPNNNLNRTAVRTSPAMMGDRLCLASLRFSVRQVEQLAPAGRADVAVHHLAAARADEERADGAGEHAFWRCLVGGGA